MKNVIEGKSLFRENEQKSQEGKKIIIKKENINIGAHGRRRFYKEPGNGRTQGSKKADGKE